MIRVNAIIYEVFTSLVVSNMPESGLFGFIYRVTDVIYKLAWSNVLWFFTAGFPIVFLLLGDRVIATMSIMLISPPGTVALFHVMRKWMDDNDVTVWSEYWSGWKANWKRAYKVVDTYLIIGLILIVDYLIVSIAEQPMIKWFGFLLLPIIILYLLTSVTLLPLFVRFQWKLVMLFKNAFIMAIGHLFSSLAVLIGVCVMIICAFQLMPPLAFIFFASLTSWAFTWQTDRIVRRVQKLVDEKGKNSTNDP